MNDLMANLDKIHTTALGITRIKKNLELKTDDVVNWCRKKIKEAELASAADDIVRKGKNWYVHAGDSVITINARSYTIITAHKNK